MRKREPLPKWIPGPDPNAPGSLPGRTEKALFTAEGLLADARLARTKEEAFTLIMRAHCMITEVLKAAGLTKEIHD